jgi:hypothetical protein
MIHYEHDEISNGYQCYNAGILQGVQTTKERKRYDNKPNHISEVTDKSTSGGSIHKAGYPKMPVDKKRNRISTLIEPSNYAWHKISDDDQVAYPHTEAFDSNCSIEYYSCIWICDL